MMVSTFLSGMGKASGYPVMVINDIQYVLISWYRDVEIWDQVYGYLIEGSIMYICHL